MIYGDDSCEMISGRSSIVAIHARWSTVDHVGMDDSHQSAMYAGFLHKVLDAQLCTCATLKIQTLWIQS